MDMPLHNDPSSSMDTEEPGRLAFKLSAQGIQIGLASGESSAEFQLIGELQRRPEGGYAITPDLRASCPPRELEPLEEWLAGLTTLERDTQDQASELAALTLPHRLAQAQQWLASTDHPLADYLALRIANAMQPLEEFLDSAAPSVSEPTAAPAKPAPGVRGRLDEVLPFRITGWALQPGTEAPLTIRLRVNDRRELTALADRPRPDVRDRGLHPTGNCGFLIHLPDDEPLASGDLVRAYADPGNVELNNSPVSCAA